MEGLSQWICSVSRTLLVSMCFLECVHLSNVCAVCLAVSDKFSRHVRRSFVQPEIDCAFLCTVVVLLSRSMCQPKGQCGAQGWPSLSLVSPILVGSHGASSSSVCVIEDCVSRIRLSLPSKGRRKGFFPLKIAIALIID